MRFNDCDKTQRFQAKFVAKHAHPGGDVRLNVHAAIWYGHLMDQTRTVVRAECATKVDHRSDL